MSQATIVNHYLEVHAAHRRATNAVLRLQTTVSGVTVLSRRVHLIDCLGGLAYAATRATAPELLQTLANAVPLLLRHCTTDETCLQEANEVRRACNALDFALVNLLANSPGVF